MEIKKLTNSITSKLSYLSTEIKLNGSLNLLDTNVLSEDIFKTILNIVYGYNLQNANNAEPNIKAIDLVDYTAKTIIQVSADNSKTKVQNSLSKIDVSKFNGYSFKFVCISKNVSHLRNYTFDIPPSISFNTKTDCYDLKRITKDALSKDIDTVKNLATYLEKAILPTSADERRPSVITYVINCLADTNLAEVNIIPDTILFDLIPKINLNKLVKWKSIVTEYTVYSTLVDKIYGEYNKLGVNKSLTVLSFLHDLYSNLSTTNSGDELFDKLLEEVYKIVDGDNTCNDSLTREELLMNIKIVLVDSFVKCKIFEKPI